MWEVQYWVQEDWWEHASDNENWEIFAIFTNEYCADLITNTTQIEKNTFMKTSNYGKIDYFFQKHKELITQKGMRMGFLQNFWNLLPGKMDENMYEVAKDKEMLIADIYDDVKNIFKQYNLNIEEEKEKITRSSNEQVSKEYRWVYVLLREKYSYDDMVR